MALSSSQIKHIKKLINDHFNVFIYLALGLSKMSEDDQRSLMELNLGNIRSLNIIEDAYVLGKQFHKKDIPNISYETWKNSLIGGQTNIFDHETLENLKESSTHYFDNLKEIITNKIMNGILMNNKEILLDKKSAPTPISYDQDDIDQNRIKKIIEDLKEVKESVNSDWNKVITTELSSAHSQGITNSILEDNKDPLCYFFGPLDEFTCKNCIEFYHDGGSYKIYRLSELLKNGTNAGKKRENWKPVISPAHPGCRHTLAELPDGYTLDENGELQFVSNTHHELDNNEVQKKSHKKMITLRKSKKKIIVNKK